MVDDAATLIAVANRYLSCSAAKPQAANPHEPRAIMVPTRQALLRCSKDAQTEQAGKGSGQVEAGFGPAGRLFQGQPLAEAGDEGRLSCRQGHERRIVGPAQDEKARAAGREVDRIGRRLGL